MEAPASGLCSLSRTRPVTVGEGHGVSDVGSGERQGFAAGTGGRTGVTGAIVAALAVVVASVVLGDSAAFGVSVVFDGSAGFDAPGVAIAGADGVTDSLWAGAFGLSSAGGRTSINEPTRAACGADLVPGDRMTYPEAIATHSSRTIEPPSTRLRRVELCGVSNIVVFRQ